MVRKITEQDIVGLYLNDYGRRIYLREMADLLGKPHQTIKPYIEKLIATGVLTEVRRRKIVEYGLNFSDFRMYDYLVLAEKKKLLERLESDSMLKVLFEKLSGFFGSAAFVIFGSAVGGLKKGSDIDLLVVGTEKVDSVLKEFEEVYDKKIHKVQVSSFGEVDKVLIKEIYKKHLILNDTEKIVRFFGELHGNNRLV